MLGNFLENLYPTNLNCTLTAINMASKNDVTGKRITNFTAEEMDNFIRRI